MMFSRTRFGLQGTIRKKQFYVRALGDKLLTREGKIVYLLFMDVDAPFRGLPPELELKQHGIDFDVRIFQTKNGFHAVGSKIVNLEWKKHWFALWHSYYPESDYPLRVFCWLCPHEREEALYIAELALTVTDDPPLSEYYRDKAVWESLL
jgi:hypothetical protein